MNSLKLDNWEEFKDLYARNKFATSAPLVSVKKVIKTAFFKDVTSTSQGQKFQKFEEYPKSVRIKMADLAGR